MRLLQHVKGTLLKPRRLADYQKSSYGIPPRRMTRNTFTATSNKNSRVYSIPVGLSNLYKPPNAIVILMTTDLGEFENRIHDLVERENECDDLFKDIRNGNGENSLRYLALRDACKELRRGILRSAMSAGLTRESINMKIKEVRNQTIATDTKQTKKNQQNQPISSKRN